VATPAAICEARELLAIDCVNNPRDFMAAKKLIAARTLFDPSKLSDHRVPLKEAAITA
jgi:3-phenylpropionate/trans-cinnamate dioxygenase ferredoxin reductase subunit